MRLGIYALFALLLGAFAAHFLLQDRGYVLINFAGYVIEMSVPGLVMVLAGLYLAIRGVVALVHAPRRFGAALVQRRVRRSGGDLLRGFIHLTEGDWARSERLLTQSVTGSDTPLVNYLLAARAAQLQGAHERRDQWLALARQEPDADAAVLLTQAELQLDGGELDAALATLQRLEQLRPEHPGALALLARTYQARADGAQLVSLLPRIGRARVSPELRETLAVQALASETARADLTREHVDEVWNALPSELRAAPRLGALRALALDRLGAGDEAERELRAALKKTWAPALVDAYGRVRGADSAKQLKQAETWLKTYPEDGALLLAAARLCMANELWGKAQSFVESSLAVAPVPDAYALYGRLLAQLGEGDRAALAFRSGLALTSPTARDDAAEPPRLQPPRPVQVEKKAS
jgi:HemY protein